MDKLSFIGITFIFVIVTAVINYAALRDWQENNMIEDYHRNKASHNVKIILGVIFFNLFTILAWWVMVLQEFRFE